MILDRRCQIWNYFHVKFHKILHQISTCFQNLGHSWQSYECLFAEICTKTFWCHFQVCKFPLKSCLKKPVFWARKLKYFWNGLVKFKKRAHSEILSLRAFKWCKNKIILMFQFWPDSPSKRQVEISLFFLWIKVRLAYYVSKVVYTD